jgi:hypothetical protein
MVYHHHIFVSYNCEARNYDKSNFEIIFEPVWRILKSNKIIQREVIFKKLQKYVNN